MKNLLLAAMFAGGICAAVEAAPTDTVTQADLQALIERLNKLEAENKAQAAKIAELEGATKKAALAAVAKSEAKADKTTEVSESGKVYTTESGKKYFLADATANIFEPLSESGLQITPYGYLVLEATYNSAQTDLDWTADKVASRASGSQKSHTTTLSVQDSILGIAINTPEAWNGWKFSGKAEFDLVDTMYGSGDANDYGFHWRHLYVNAEHESGWSILAGQTWHLWKMVTPNEIDGAWLENTGYPYRRSPQIRVTKKWELDQNSSLEVRAGIVKNGPNMGEDRDGNGTSDNSQSCWPIFQGAAIYDRKAAWEEGDRRWLVGIGGMYGRDKSRRWMGDDDYSGDYDEYDTKMIMVAGQMPFLEKFTLTGQFFAGDNLGRVQAGVGQGVGYHTPGEKGKEVSTIGGFCDLRYDLNDTWAFAIGHGFDNPTDSEAENTHGSAYGILNNQRSYVDAFYQLNANLHFGLEYAYLRTKWAEGDGDTAPDHRIQFTAFYDF